MSRTTLLSNSSASSSAKLSFTEDHELLRQTARRFAGEQCPMTEVRGFAAGDARLHRPLARAMAEQGWLGLLIPEDYGGAGMDHRALAVVLEEVGRHLMPAPLLAAVLAGQAITRAGSETQKRRWLPGLAMGEQLATMALSEPGGSWEPDAVTTTAHLHQGTDDGFVLKGIKNHVLWADSAHWMITPAVLDSGDIALFVVDPAGEGVHVEPEVGVDPTRPMARVVLDKAHVSADQRLSGGTLDEWRALHMAGCALLATEMVGAAQAVLQRTRDYANERVQFARPIGSFQAVKHPLVNLLIALENARSLCAGAVAALDAHHDSDSSDSVAVLARMAKVAATEALGFAVDRGVQLHGGYGFTWDCDMHFYFKRSLWSAATLGDAAHHRRHLADRLLG